MVKTTYDLQWGNVIDPTQEIKAIVEVGNKIKAIVQKAVKNGSISEKDFQNLTIQNNDFQQKTTQQIAFLAPILDEKEIKDYKKDIEQLQKVFEESNCSTKEETYAFSYKGTGYGMSFKEDIFEFEKEINTEKCLEKLQKYEELSQKITQKLEKDKKLYDELEEIWKFLKECYQSYKNQKGFVPRCLWDHDNYVPNGVFVPYVSDPALVSGIIDSAAETVEMAVDLVNILDCFNPISFRAWLEDCKVKRTQTIDTLKSLRDLLKKETLEIIFEEFKDYISETAGFDNQARYNQGKLLFDVAGSFVGITEIKAALKGGNLVAILGQTLKKIPKDAIKIVTSIQKITTKTAKEIVRGLVDSSEKIIKKGKFIDDILEADYQKYLKRKAKQNKPPKDRLEWKEAREHFLHDSPIARGNAFNKKAWKEEWYPAWEVQLDNGKFMDGYNPYTKEIVSRKATDLTDIQEDTFIRYLNELRNKYAPPKKITTKKKDPIYKEITNTELPWDSKLILEIPESNKNFDKIEEYIKIAKEKGIEIRFRPE